MADPTAFWNRIAARYARRPIADEAAYRTKLDRTRAILSPEMRVLELGCGTGSTALAHAAHVREIVATDFSEAMIRIARDKAEAAGVENVRFALGDAGAADQPEGAFDAVLALNLLHLLDDPEAGVRRAFALLKPGGAFVSATACIREMNPTLRLALPVMRLVGLAPRVSVFGAADLLRWMEGAGFAIEHRWSQDDGRTLLLIARKPDAAGLGGDARAAA